MNVHDGDEGCIEVVAFGFATVQNLDGIGATRNGEDRAVVEILREFLGIESCRGDN